MIIESGFIVFLGLVFMFIKLPPRISLKLLGSPLILDLSASILMLLVHWGTFSGVMAAATAGLLTSGFTTAARFAVGYIDKGKYYPGQLYHFDVQKLK